MSDYRCSTCQDKGYVVYRVGANDWEQEECPDCSGYLPSFQPRLPFMAQFGLL